MRAEIDRLYENGEVRKGSDLLERFMRTFIEPAGQGDVRPRSNAYRLIAENLSEPDTEINHEAKRPRRSSPSPPKISATLPDRKSEEEQAAALLASGKGQMILSNGDVIENGRRLIQVESDDMDQSLTPLSPVLMGWLRTFKHFISLTVFNRKFILLDYQAWSSRQTPSESKIAKGAADLRIYGGAPPPEELRMQYEEWRDAMKLFIRYIRAEGWLTLAERFEGHMEVVDKLRDDMGWMVALRYCRKIRQGVMRETIDKDIKNFSVLQKKILHEVEIICGNFTERALATNPYAVGGTRAHIDPLTGDPTRLADKPNKKPVDTKQSDPEKPKKDWLPYAEYRAVKKQEREELAKREARNDSYRGDGRRPRDRDRDSDRDERGRSWRDNRGRDRRRSRSRSRSRDRGYSRKGRGGRNGRGRT